ncbi:hypothetical protein I546_3313 [Mycobacterium kansasii 732]|nr:hypothetical protein I546_3313 [Mycobacterium kansasii 732]
MFGSVGSVGHVRRHTRTVTPSTTVWANRRHRCPNTEGTYVVSPLWV